MEEVFTVVEPVDDSDGSKLVIGDKENGKKKKTLKWVLVGLSVIALAGCVVAVVLTQTDSGNDEPVIDTFEDEIQLAPSDHVDQPDQVRHPPRRPNNDISPMKPCKGTPCTEHELTGNSENCSTYYICSSNSWILMVCNEDLCFDSRDDHLYCNWCEDAICQAACDTTTSRTDPTTTEPPTTVAPTTTTTTTVAPTTTITPVPPTTATTTVPLTTTAPPITTVTPPPPITTTIVKPTPTTTTPVPPSTTPDPDTPDIPWYEIRLWGNFSTVGDEDITPECSNQYLESIRNKATAMISVVNTLLGSGGLCPGHAQGAFGVVTVATMLFPTGSTGQTNIDFLMRLDINLRIDEVYDCTHEVSLYLQDHSNWDTPLIPDIPECPSVEFETDRFNDVGSGWFCFNNQRSTSPSQPLGYDIQLRSNFNTSDESDLTAQCAVAYNDEWQRVVMQQTDSTNDKLGSDICNDVDITILAGVPSFTYQGFTGHVDVTFVLRIGDEHSFVEALDCVEEMIGYLIPHTNWQTPLLPPEIGCPFLVFEGQQFTEEIQRWICSL